MSRGLGDVYKRQGIKGDTASGGSKPATLETGAIIQVPFFVKAGDKLIVNTVDSTYVSRA